MKSRVLGVLSIAAIMSSASPAMANTNCTPAKKLIGAVKSFYAEKPELTNLINPTMSIDIKGVDGHPDPTHVLYRFEDFEQSLPIVDGALQGFEQAANWSKEGELCKAYGDVSPPETDESTAALSVSFAFPFRRTDGVFNVDEIKEGLKDGSKIMKRLAPKGLGFVVPGLKTFTVNPVGNGTDLPMLTFYRDGQPTDVQIYRYDQTQYIRFKDLKSAKIDQVEINGPYKSSAFFKIDPEELAQAETQRLAKIESESN